MGVAAYHTTELGYFTEATVLRFSAPHLLALLVTLVALARPALAAERIRYVDTDAIGNVRVVTDEGGNVVERHDYLPFGEEWCGTAVCGSVTPGQPKRFTGKERDAETGLDYFGARYHRAHLGRFTTVDPGQKTGENLVDPQRWNRYAYVRNNPLRYVDPDGRESDDAQRAAQGAAAAAGTALVQDARVRADYVSKVRGLSPTDSAGRTAAKIAAREASTPVGAALAEAMAPIAGEAGRVAGTASKTRAGVNSAMTSAGAAGKGLLVVGIGISVANVAMAPEGEQGRVATQEVGAWAGALSFGAAGAKLGAVIGAGVGGPVGAVAGGIIGGLVGGIGGSFAGAQAGNNIYEAARSQ